MIGCMSAECFPLDGYRDMILMFYRPYQAEHGTAVYGQAVCKFVDGCPVWRSHAFNYGKRLGKAFGKKWPVSRHGYSIALISAKTWHFKM